MTHLFELATIFLTLTLIVVNIVYTRLMARQVEASLRPYVVIRTYFPPGTRLLYLIVENRGASAAKELKLEIDRDFYAFETEESNIRNLNAFRRVIPCFPAGSALYFELAPGSKAFESEGDKTPASFNVKAAYTHAGKRYEESTAVDLMQYAGSEYPPSPELDELGKIRSALEAIAKYVQFPRRS